MNYVVDSSLVYFAVGNQGAAIITLPLIVLLVLLSSNFPKKEKKLLWGIVAISITGLIYIFINQSEMVSTFLWVFVFNLLITLLYIRKPFLKNYHSRK